MQHSFLLEKGFFASFNYLVSSAFLLNPLFPTFLVLLSYFGYLLLPLPLLFCGLFFTYSLITCHVNHKSKQLSLVLMGFCSQFGCNKSPKKVSLDVNRKPLDLVKKVSKSGQFKIGVLKCKDLFNAGKSSIHLAAQQLHMCHHYYSLLLDQ